MNEQKTEIMQASILIVDDNPKNIQVLGSTLQSNSFKVEFATSGKTALELLKDIDFDLVLLDIMMPEMDGYEVCRKIRRENKYNNIPIIFLTAKTDKESLVLGFEAGAQDYSTKPFDSRELLSRVKAHLELKFNKEKLEIIHQELEDKVLKRTQQLEKAIEELNELDSVKTQFINMLNHEIRTPLNGIIGSIDLLKSTINNPELEQLIEILESSANQLEKFSFSTLLITRLRSGKYRIVKKSEPLKELATLCITTYQDQINNKQIKARISESVSNASVSTDFDLLKEAVFRIFENAIKFSEQGGVIDILITSEHDTAIFEIKDYGCGFKEEFLQADINTYFKKVKEKGNSFGILNLYLIFLVVDYLSGKFELGNNPEGGAYVKISLSLE